MAIDYIRRLSTYAWRLPILSSRTGDSAASAPSDEVGDNFVYSKESESEL